MESPAPSDRPGETQPAAVRRSRLTFLLLLAAVLASIAIYQSARLRAPKSPEERLREDSASSLGALAEKLGATAEGERTALLVRYLADSSPSLRYAAVDALGERKGKEVADSIAGAFEDSASTVRQRAVEVLHVVEPDRGYRLLLAALRDEDTWIREAAATQLSFILRREGFDRRRATQSLVAALDTGDPIVTRTAVSTLVRITGRPWRIRRGMTPADIDKVIQRWRNWWDEEVRSGRAQAVALPEPIRPSRRDAAPSFRIRDLDGTTHTDEALRGGIVLVHFYGTECAPCDEEMRDLGRLYGEYKPRGVDMLGVAMPPHDAGEVRRWCTERGVDFPQALSTDRVVEQFGHIHAVPVSVLIDRAGMVRYRWEGERDARVYRAAFERLLKE